MPNINSIDLTRLGLIYIQHLHGRRSSSEAKYCMMIIKNLLSVRWSSVCIHASFRETLESFRPSGFTLSGLSGVLRHRTERHQGAERTALWTALSLGVSARLDAALPCLPSYSSQESLSKSPTPSFIFWQHNHHHHYFIFFVCVFNSHASATINI